jgi:16S rRNA (cytosine1407-C5)-methyltransferase
MAASPGGKTTQLAEYYPNSVIVANEFTQNRITQLISNLERIGWNNFCVTNYNWVFFRDLPERFDKVIIDAPCSGEWIGFKAIETIKHWNIKKIKWLSGLQENLLERALVSAKVWWEILYSTCTLNKLENEWVIEYIEKKYPESFRVTYSKRFWPHIEKSGWFFVAKIEKLKSVETNFKKREAKKNMEIKKIDKASLEALSRFIKKYDLDLWDSELYVYKSDILAIKRNPDFWELINDLYLTRLGQRIWNIVNWEFTPNYYLARDYELKNAKKIEIESIEEVYDYLKWKEIETSLELEDKEYLIISYKNLKIWGW